MKSNWHAVRLGDVCQVNPDKRDSSWPHSIMSYIDIASVGNGVLNEQPRTIQASEAPSRAQRLVRAGDTIVSTVRPNRRSFLYIGKSTPTTVVSTGFAVLRAGEDLDPRFLYYLVTEQAFTDYLIAHEEGSAYPAINVDVLSDAEVTIPKYPEQHAIAHILGTLDDKIELNRRMNETLESMARALFKSWFIDFDPVRAKAEGRDPGLPADVAALFPDSFRDSELGEIPEGWKVQPFSDIVDIVGGGTPKTTVPEYWGGDIPWFSVVDAPRASDVWAVNTEKKITRAGVEMSSTRILPVGSTIISARGTVGRLALVGVPMAMNQSCYGLQGKTEGTSSFTYFSTRRLVAVLQQHAHGSVFDTITRDTLAGVSIPLPPANVVQAFEFRVSPILEQLRATLFESHTLAALRNALLPKLLSGEIRVVGVSLSGSHLTHSERCFP